MTKAHDNDNDQNKEMIQEHIQNPLDVVFVIVVGFSCRGGSGGRVFISGVCPANNEPKVALLLSVHSQLLDEVFCSLSAAVAVATSSKDL